MGLCMCGADDCPRCFPSHFNRCPIHGLYDEDLEDCPKCEREIDEYDNREDE
jgi:hypothetical protein